jgi:putative hemolysin
MLVSLLTTLLLVAVVGVCNAAHVALSHARRNRLEDGVEKGAFGSATALRLVERQAEVVSGCRVVIALFIVTTILVSGGLIVDRLMHLLAPTSEVESVAIYAGVVALLSFTLVVFGDLVSCEIATRYPELVARILAPCIKTMLFVVRPFSSVANIVVNAIVGPLKPEAVSDEDVEEDIRDLVDEGQRAGVIEPGEREIINRVFKLDDKPLATLMTPRTDVIFVDRDANLSALIREAAEARHTWFPVRGNGEDEVAGILSVHDLIMLQSYPERFPRGMADIIVEPIEVPLSINALKLFEVFRESGKRFAVVRDEYGGISGIVTVYDVLQVIVGDIADGTSPEYRQVLQREDGSYLVDASSDVREVFEELGIADESPFNGAEFHSVGGFVMTTLGYVPKEGERFEALGYVFEVVDMDG